MKRIILILMMMVSFSFAYTIPNYYYSKDLGAYGKPYFNNPVVISETPFSSGKICTTNYFHNSSFVNGKLRTYIWFVQKQNSSNDCGGVDVLVEWSQNTATPCAVGLTDIGNGFCSAPVPTCGTNMTLNADKTACVCNGGYKADDVTYDTAGNITTINTCKPFKNCPPQMKYFWTDKATTIIGTQTDYAGCIPRTDLSEADCGVQGGTYYKWANDMSDGTSQQAKYMMSYGEGCVNQQYLTDNAFWDNFNLLMSGFILHGNATFPMALAKKAVTPEMLALEYKQAGNGANLLTHEPEVIDLVMGADGVYAELGLNAKTANLDLDTVSSFNQWLKDNGLYGKNNPGYEYPTNDLGINGSVSSAMNNMYKGGDELKFSDNILGASKISGKADAFASMDTSLNVGAVKTSTIDLSSLLDNASTTKSYPVTSTVLEKTTSATGEITTKTASKINFPDGTYSTVTSLATKFADATTKYDITISTPISTTNGIKTIEQAYTVTKNASGATTNTVTTKEPTISYTDSSGHTVTSPNTSVSTATADKNLASPLDLTNIQNALNQMNKTLTETKTLVKDMIEHIPANRTALDTALNNFKIGMSDLTLSLNNATDFVNGLLDTLNDLQKQLDDALDKFKDEPTISMPSGQCPFQASWYGQTFQVDPCKFVAPYRPIMVIFLTFFMSFAVFLFALKYLFNVSLGGK
nr:hypothetical protein [Sulfurospirillum sp. 'SP']